VFARGTPPEVSYLFKHALVQDVAYGSLLRNSRQRLHERIVTTLEHQFSDIVANEPERIARACIDAGQDEKALKYLLKSAEESVSRSANLEALNHTEKALKILHGLRHSAKLDKYELRLLLLRGVALAGGSGMGGCGRHRCAEFEGAGGRYGRGVNRPNRRLCDSVAAICTSTLTSRTPGEWSCSLAGTR